MPELVNVSFKLSHLLLMFLSDGLKLLVDVYSRLGCFLRGGELRGDVHVVLWRLHVGTVCRVINRHVLPEPVSLSLRGKTALIVLLENFRFYFTGAFYHFPISIICLIPQSLELCHIAVNFISANLKYGISWRPRWR